MLVSLELFAGHHRTPTKEDMQKNIDAVAKALRTGLLTDEEKQHIVNTINILKLIQTKFP